MSVDDEWDLGEWGPFEMGVSMNENSQASSKRRQKISRRQVLFGLVGGGALGLIGCGETDSTGDAAPDLAPVGGPTASPAMADAGRTTLSTPNVVCGDILAPIDKQNALPADCQPTDLTRLPDIVVDPAPQRVRAAVVSPLLELLDAAKRSGVRLVVNSSFRSYNQQARIFDSAVRGFGLDYAERTSARAGHSEHQLGTAVDVTTFDSSHPLEDFVGTPAATWVLQHSWRYGFVVSYPEGKSAITGYDHEPWHVRYIGTDVARQVHESGRTLREFLRR